MAINNNNIVSFVFFTISVILLLTTFYIHKPDASAAAADEFDKPEKVISLDRPHDVETVKTPVAPVAPPKPDPAKPRFIFVDLGANRADTLEVFLKHEGAKFSFDFPRPDWATYEEADIYLFEANPVFNQALIDSKEKYRAQGINVNIFPTTVVDVIDGTRTFYLDTVTEGHDFWGSSTHQGAPDVQNSHSKGTELTAINISRWLLMNTLPHDFVVVKMDIEGAEYEVLPHMVEMSAWKVVDHLFVEYHGFVLKADEKAAAEEKAKAAQTELEAKGVKMPSYDSAA